MGKTKVIESIDLTIKRVRYSTRRGKKGLLIVGVDKDKKEHRWWMALLGE